MVFVSGTTGFDYGDMSISDDLTEQTEQCLKNIQSALEQAGATFQESFGSVRPAKSGRLPSVLARVCESISETFARPR